MGDIDLKVIFSAENSKKFQETRFWKEKSVENVITLGPSAQVTLVLYLWSNVICFVCHAEISRTTMLHVVLLVSSKSSQWAGVHWLGLRLFGATMWKLLVIEPFSQWKLNKIKTEKLIKTVLEFGGIFAVVGKPLASHI